MLSREFRKSFGLVSANSWAEEIPSSSIIRLRHRSFKPMRLSNWLNDKGELKAPVIVRGSSGSAAIMNMSVVGGTNRYWRHSGAALNPKS